MMPAMAPASVVSCCWPEPEAHTQSWAQTARPSGASPSSRRTRRAGPQRRPPCVRLSRRSASRRWPSHPPDRSGRRSTGHRATRQADRRWSGLQAGWPSLPPVVSLCCAALSGSVRYMPQSPPRQARCAIQLLVRDQAGYSPGATFHRPLPSALKIHILSPEVATRRPESRHQEG